MGKIMFINPIFASDAARVQTVQATVRAFLSEQTSFKRLNKRPSKWDILAFTVRMLSAIETLWPSPFATLFECSR